MANWVKSGTEFLVSTQTAGGQSAPTITRLSNGGFVVTWTDTSGTLDDADGSSIKAQIFDAAGGMVGTEFLVNTQTANNQLEPTITGLTNGGFVVSWQDTSGPDGNADVRAQVFDALGGKVGDEFLVNTEAQSEQYAPTITGLSNGGFVASWYDESGTLGDADAGSIKAQVFNAAGGKVGTAFLVNTQTANGQFSPTITGLTDGGFVVAWQDFSGTLGDASVCSIKAQRFDATGGKVGDEFLVNTQTASGQYIPTITGLTNGGFVVSWMDYSGTLGDAQGSSIKAQVFDAAGEKLGGEVLVNTQTAGPQYAPTITGLPNGGFVVSWYDYSGLHDASATPGDTDGSSIKAQVFDATGSRVGGEVLVNTVTAGDQIEPTISGLTNGDFVVSWQDTSDTLGNGDEIKAQIFHMVVNTPPTLIVAAQSVQLVEAGTGGAGISSATIALTKADADAGDIAAFDTTDWTEAGEGLVSKVGTYGSVVLDTATGVLTYTLDDARAATEALTGGQAASDSFEITVEDLNGGSVTETVSFAITGSDDTEPSTGVTIVGTAGNDVISPTQTVVGQPFATAYADTIFGNAGNDTINGGAGADRMVGGAGDDTYVVDTADDIIEELAGEGYDTVSSSVSYTLSANVEKLTLVGNDEINGTGNRGNNNLTGNWKNNVLTGLAGNDNLFGGAGNDTAVYSGDFASYMIDRLTGTVSSAAEGTDRLSSIETLRFSDGAFDWASGIFTSDAPNTPPTLTVGAQSVALVEASVLDFGTSSATIALEKADADAGDIASFDTSGWTNAGAGLLSKVGVYGSVVLDTATGILSYTLDDARAATNALAGGEAATDSFDITVTDLGGGTVTKTASFAITGTDDGVAITGTSGNDVISPTETVEGQPLPTPFGDLIVGNAGNDTINGGAGADRMVGGAGDDAYVVDMAGDIVEELAGGGYDAVNAFVSYTLSANVEKLTLVGSDSINATGNAGNNNLTGNWKNNVLTGLGGNDKLFGGAGIDTAVYTGDFASYTIDRPAGTVSSAAEGVDTLNSIETLQFANGTYDWASGTFLLV